MLVTSAWAVAAVVARAAVPLIFMAQVPLAPVPVLVGASLAICASVKAVVASWVVLVLRPAVGAVGVPLRAGLLSVA